MDRLRRLVALALLAALPAQTGCAEPAVLVILSVDTLRADHLGAYAGPAGLTPHLDALARDSVVFERAYAPTPMTLPSMGTLHTGLHPLEHSTTDNTYVLPAEATTLAERLRGHGWRTGAVVGNWVLRRGSGLDQGFDLYDDTLPDTEGIRHEIAERTAAHTTDAALGMADALRGDGDAPFLLWVHYQDPHGPYAPPDDGQNRYLEEERREADGRRTLPVVERGLGGIPPYQLLDPEREPASYRAAYKGEIAYVDAEIGRLLEGLGDRAMLDRAVIVFAADHGEAMGEDDYWFAHGEYLSDTQVRVPLFLRIPGRSPERRTDVAGLVDLSATLMALFDLPGGDLPGRRLLAPGAASLSSRIHLSTLAGSSHPRAGLVSDGFKYVVTASDDGARVVSEQLYALGDDDLDVSSQYLDALGALRAHFLDFQRALPHKPGQPASLSPEDEARLRALGYLPTE